MIQRRLPGLGRTYQGGKGRRAPRKPRDSGAWKAQPFVSFEVPEALNAIDGSLTQASRVSQPSALEAGEGPSPGEGGLSGLMLPQPPAEGTLGPLLTLDGFNLRSP